MLDPHRGTRRLGLSASELLALPLDERVGRINAAIADFVPGAERAAVAGQLFGEEGSIAMARIDTATLRQATEDVRDFGIVVSETDADRIERANAAISRLGLIWRGLSNQLAAAAAPALEAVANAMAAVGTTTGPLGLAIRGLFDNVGRLTAYAATFAGLLAGRWVAGLVAAAVSVQTLATGLVLLRGALIRTGIGALIVAAGELVYQFGRLVTGAGGFGEALSLLGNLASEVWERIKSGGQFAGAVPAVGLGADRVRLADGAFRNSTQLGRLPAWRHRRPRWCARHGEHDARGERGGDPRRIGLLRDRGRRRRSQRPRRWVGGFGRGRCGGGHRSAEVAAGIARRRCRFGRRGRRATAWRRRERRHPRRRRQPRQRRRRGGKLRGVADALDTAKQAAGGAAEAIAAVDDRTAELAATLQSNVAQGLGQLFAGLITGATSLKESIGSVIARLGELALTRGFETLLSGIGFGTGPLGQIASLFLPTPRAGGGPVMAGMPYLVGERGPELIVPRAPGRVIPNHALGGAAGQGSAAPVAITVQVTGARGNAEIRQMVEAGVTQGLRAYDARLADRVTRIGADPRFRG